MSINQAIICFNNLSAAAVFFIRFLFIFEGVNEIAKGKVERLYKNPDFRRSPLYIFIN
jgi:hypothetical protein